MSNVLAELADLCQVLSGLSTLLLKCSEPEALYRCLVGVGTVLVRGSSECAQLAATLDIAFVLHTLTSAATLKVKECAMQVKAMLPSS